MYCKCYARSVSLGYHLTQKKKKMGEIYLYQSEEGSHVTTMNLNSRFEGDNGRKEFMAIVDLFV